MRPAAHRGGGAEACIGEGREGNLQRGRGEDAAVNGDGNGSSLKRRPSRGLGGAKPTLCRADTAARLRSLSRICPQPRTVPPRPFRPPGVQAAQGLRVPGRGALHRGAGAHGARPHGAGGRGPGRRGHHDGCGGGGGKVRGRGHEVWYRCIRTATQSKSLSRS